MNSKAIYLKGRTPNKPGIISARHAPCCVIPGGAFSDPESMVAVRWEWLKDGEFE